MNLSYLHVVARWGAGKPVSIGSDIYRLSVGIYRLLVGKSIGAEAELR